MDGANKLEDALRTVDPSTAGLPPMLRALRILGYIEGSSFLILLLIAMPLKRLANMPEAVTIVGMAHGLLFIAYVLLGLAVGFAHKWPLKKIATMLVAAVIPLGTFVFDGALKREEAAA